MTREDKELLLKDICARIPYGVKFACGKNVYLAKGLDLIVTDEGDWEYAVTAKSITPIEIDFIKPYLFPLSSMTDEMMEELNVIGFFKYNDTIANVSHLESKCGISEEIYTYLDIECISYLIEFFHKHHIDYKGLIERGLALDATGLNIY